VSVAPIPDVARNDREARGDGPRARGGHKGEVGSELVVGAGEQLVPGARDVGRPLVGPRRRLTDRRPQHGEIVSGVGRPGRPSGRRGRERASVRMRSLVRRARAIERALERRRERRPATVQQRERVAQRGLAADVGLGQHVYEPPSVLPRREGEPLRVADTALAAV
jgi:hypothetical protein